MQKRKTEAGDDSDASQDDYISNELIESIASAQAASTSSLSYAKQRLKRLREAEIKAAVVAPKVLREQERLEAMDREISVDNKGFKMLGRMGFTKGMGLGVPERQGRTEPIQINPKQGNAHNVDRAGIGAAKDFYEQAARKRTSKEKRNLEERFEQAKGSFRNQQVRRFDMDMVRKDLAKARVACQDLDEKRELCRTEFWPLIYKAVCNSYGIASNGAVGLNPDTLEVVENEFEELDVISM